MTWLGVALKYTSLRAMLRSDLFVVYQRFCVVPTTPNGEIWLATLDQPMGDRPRSCCAVFDRLAMGLIEISQNILH
jgi:hypothetical protein